MTGHQLHLRVTKVYIHLKVPENTSTCFFAIFFDFYSSLDIVYSLFSTSLPRPFFGALHQPLDPFFRNIINDLNDPKLDPTFEQEILNYSPITFLPNDPTSKDQSSFRNIFTRSLHLSYEGDDRVDEKASGSVDCSDC